MKTSLLVAAHPDDIEVNMAHFAQRRIAEGHTVLALVATDGTASTIDMKGSGFVAEGHRFYESVLGLGILGINNVMHAGLADGRLHEREQLAALWSVIANIVVAQTVTEIVTFDEQGLDGHSDHVAVTKAAHAVAATYDVPHYMRTFRAVDVIMTGDPLTKLAAMQAHGSQYDLVNGDTATQMRLAPYLQQYGLAAEQYVLAS